MSNLPDEPTITSSDSIGVHLKKIRETQGLSLDQVASLTRIQAKFLQALENEEFQLLPEQVFTRGFVRTYARSLGISEEDTLRRFSESSSDYYQQGQKAQHQAQLQIQEEKRGKLNRNLVIIISIIILVALGFLLPNQQQSPPPSSPPEQEHSELSSPDLSKSEKTNVEPEETELSSLPIKEEESPPAEQEAQSDLDPSPAMPSPAIAETPTPSAAPAESISPSTDPLRLEIQATQLTWVVVKSDNDDPKEALLQPGQTATWEAQQQFTLTLGNAAGSVVKLNGEPRGPFGKPGQVVREVVLKP
ncbi:MAG: XRE family transcriptional regulator [Nitrospirales bacterium]|nr:MAG: XRE family transcriptional regulator [Nitrospirales bacterium]